MKRHLLFLLLGTMLSFVSVSCNASPPFTEVGICVPTIKQTVAVAPQENLTVTPIMVSLPVDEVYLVEDFSFTLTKVDEDYTSCAISAPTKDVQVVDTSTKDYKQNIFHKNIRYIEIRSTEYR